MFFLFRVNWDSFIYYFFSLDLQYFADVHKQKPLLYPTVLSPLDGGFFFSSICRLYGSLIGGRMFH